MKYFNIIVIIIGVLVNLGMLIVYFCFPAFYLTMKSYYTLPLIIHSICLLMIAIVNYRVIFLRKPL